jgi:hypothetical protein
MWETIEHQAEVSVDVSDASITLRSRLALLICTCFGGVNNATVGMTQRGEKILAILV